ncbi:unnamed protein product [Symbiodinium sp. CCMP2592]|nr:unnamed protein product [Symbiodinium sp. CCMP2592]
MGRSKKTWQPDEDWSHSGGQERSWSLWKGAWPKSPTPNNRSTTQLRYDQVDPGSEHWDYNQTWSEQPEEQIPSDLPVAFREIQRALTQARKADARVRKLRADVTYRQAQFVKYENMMKQAFAKNHKQYEQDLAKLQDEIQNASEAGRTATKDVQMLVLYGQIKENAQETKQAASADRLWADLIRSNTDGEAPAETSFLSEAMSLVRNAQPGILRPRDGLPAAPSRVPREVTPPRSRRVMPMSPQQGKEDVVLRDPASYGFAREGGPYPISPTAPAASTAIPPGLEDLDQARSGSRPKNKTGDGTGTRQPVKKIVQGVAHTIHPGGVPLSDKLEARRQAAEAEMNMAGRAMRPFGLPAGAAGSADPNPEEDRLRYMYNGQCVEIRVSNSDDDDLEEKDAVRGPVGRTSPDGLFVEQTGLTPLRVQTTFFAKGLLVAGDPNSRHFFGLWMLSWLGRLSPLPREWVGFIPISFLRPRLELSLRLLVLPTFFPEACEAQPVGADNLCTDWILALIEAWLIPFARSLLFLFFGALVRLFVRPLRAHGVLKNTVAFPFLGIPPTATVPLGSIGCVDVQAMQKPPFKHKGARSHAAAFSCPARISIFRRLCLGIFGFLTLPLPLGNSAFGPVALGLTLPVLTGAMARAGEAPAVGSFDHDIAPEDLTALQGVSDDGIHPVLTVLKEQLDMLADRFPELVPVQPQPTSDSATFVAIPAWSDARVVVLLDGRRINGCVFSAAVPPVINRESLLLAAGHAHSASFQVFVHGLVTPLQPYQSITVAHGMLVTLAPADVWAPAHFDLADMLQDRTTWSLEVALPGPTAYPGSHFRVFTDGMPFVFKVEPGRRPSFQADLKKALHTKSEFLSVLPSAPQIPEHFHLGIPMSGVLLATEVGRGQVLLIEYVEDLSDEPSGDGSDDGGHDGTSGSTHGRRNKNQKRHATSAPDERPRSRSPRSSHNAGGPAATPAALQDPQHAGSLTDEPNQESRVAMWSQQAVHPFDVVPSDSTSVLLTGFPAASEQPDTSSRVATWSRASEPESTSALLLTTSAPHSGDTVSDHSVPDPPCQDSATGLGSVDAPTHVAVRIFVTDFPIEGLEVPIAACSDVVSTLSAVDQSWHGPLRAYFPYLAYVRPQPDPSHLLCIASPSWPGISCTVCFDLAAVDGRQFAAQLPPRIDRYIAMQFAGLAPAAEIDLYCPGRQDPLVDGDELLVGHGHCFSFRPRGTGPPPCCDILVAGRLAAGPNTSPEAAPPGVYYCLVTDLTYRPFLLLPERSVFYRADIASTNGMRLWCLSIDPTQPPVQDACVQGRLCRTVVAVGERDSQPDDDLNVGLLDCRLLQQGWFRIFSSHDWLPLEPIRNSLLQNAPRGWIVSFVGVAPHWDWTWFRPGQVLTAFYEVAPIETPRSVQSGNDQCVLSLRKAIGTTQHFDLTVASMPSPFVLADVAAVLSGTWVLPSLLPEGLHLHPATAKAWPDLVSVEQGLAAGLDKVSVFTDGSYDGTSSFWAFVSFGHSQSGTFLLAWARGQVATGDETRSIGASEHSAVNGERTAVFWALGWLLGLSKQVQKELHSDCIVAARQADGHFGAVSQLAIVKACRSLAQVHDALGPGCTVPIYHVKGHEGHPYNELADVLAGACDVPETDLPPHLLHTCRWARQHSLEWLWLTVAAMQQSTSLPQYNGNALTDTVGHSDLAHLELNPCSAFGPAFASVPPKAPSTGFRFFARFVTVNVQTLGEDSVAQVNRTPFVRAQLESVGCLFAGLQETRARATATVTSQSHYRFLSASDSQGNLGVELWASRTVPVGWVDHRPVYCDLSDFCVLHWSPRCLIIRFVKGTFRLLLVVCHAPTAGHAQRDSWWREFSDRVIQCAGQNRVVVLGDLNARLVHPVPHRVGDLLWEHEHEPPSHFFRLLRLLDLWVPASFTACHTGLSHTWVSPGGAAVSRIDYILIPSAWEVQPGGSQVLYSVDFGHSGLDHFAVRLDIDVVHSVKGLGNQAVGTFDRARLLQPESQPELHRICASVPAVPWNLDVHSHYQCVAGYLHDQLAEAFPKQRSARRRTFFSDTTWSMRQQRVWWRRQAHKFSFALTHGPLAWAFAAWRTSRPWSSAVLAHIAGVFSDIAGLHTAVQELRSLKPAFRRSLCADRKNYLSAVADAACRSSTKDVVAKMRPLIGPPRRKQRGAVPLPTVRLENGELAQEPDEVEARWVRHFSAVEFGGPAKPEELISNCLQRQARIDLDGLEIDLAELPSRLDLEAAMRSARTGRASGNDALPAELWKLQAPVLSQVLYPLMLKAAFRLTEPLQFKGGSMHKIWKGRGPMQNCDSYRGILVSSAASKCIHGAFRRKCAEWYETLSTPLQLGGRKGFPVQLAAQAARAFQAAALRQKLNVAIVFLDLREAFHRVARPLIHGGALDDEHIAQVLSVFGIPADGMEELRTYVRDVSLIRDAGASHWAAAMLSEFQTDTWFTIRGHLATVRAGTRPGDSLADVVFSFLFAAVLRRLRQALLDAGVSVLLPWHANWEGHLQPQQQQPDDTLAPIDVSWMDDLALLIWSHTAEGLITDVKPKPLSRFLGPVPENFEWTWVYGGTAELDSLRGAQLSMARQMLRPTYRHEEALHLGAGRILATARLPTVDVELHAARLRHLALVLRKAPVEFWAILHFDGCWNSLAADSIQWLRQVFAQTGPEHPDLRTWQDVTAFIAARPQSWKRVISRAVTIAQLLALWESETAHYRGLMLRFLIQHGAHITTKDCEGESQREVCAPCRQVFPNLRCWSHHAFKCHGRVREERHFASGTQCRVCLRHFATNFRLCNHLRHSKACLAALVSAGKAGVVQPGKGSKKFLSGEDSICPAVTAAGPKQPACPDDYIPESQRADEDILAALEDVFAHPGPVHDFTGLVEAARIHFSRTCLQGSRLRATAVQWRSTLREELDRCDDVPVQWAAWHTRLADLLCEVDFAAWLVPAPDGTQPQVSTFRDAAAALSGLALDFVHIPRCLPSASDPVFYFAAVPAPGSSDPQWSFVPHDTCLTDPSHLDFASWSRTPTSVRGFSLVGLLSDFSCPSPMRSYKQLLPHLRRLRLFADFVRGVVLLWTSGCPAFLVVPPISCPGIEVVRRLARYRRKEHFGEFFANFPEADSFVQCFTL